MYIHILGTRSHMDHAKKCKHLKPTVPPPDITNFSCSCFTSADEKLPRNWVTLLRLHKSPVKYHVIPSVSLRWNAVLESRIWCSLECGARYENWQCPVLTVGNFDAKGNPTDPTTNFNLF